MVRRTRPQMCNCTSGNLEIPGSRRSLSSGAHSRDPLARPRSDETHEKRPAFAGLVHCLCQTRLSQIAAKALDAFAGVLKIGGLGGVGNAERRPEPERR